MSEIVQGILPALISVPPSAAQSYLIAAKGFFDGAEAIATHKPQSLLACAFLSSQALECALKSFLAHAGQTENQLKSIGHDLVALWNKAVSLGLQIDNTPTPWCTTLNSAHNKPYYFRYPMGLNGMVFPVISTMITEMRDLIRLVETEIKVKP